MTAYGAMAAKVGKSKEESASLRYEYVEKQLEKGGLTEKEEKEFQEEIEKFGKPPAGNFDSPERLKFFEDWLTEKEKGNPAGGSSDDGLGGAPGDILSMIR